MECFAFALEAGFGDSFLDRNPTGVIDFALLRGDFAIGIAHQKDINVLVNAGNVDAKPILDGGEVLDNHPIEPSFFGNFADGGHFSGFASTYMTFG